MEKVARKKTNEEKKQEVEKTNEEKKQEVEKQLAAAGYEPCGANRYSRIEKSGKEYVVCIDERGQLWTL